MIVGRLKDWHRPSNDDCQHNHYITLDCNCKRLVKRRGYRVCRVRQRPDTLPSHNIKPEIVVEIHPDGRLVFREAKRRRSYETTAADVYYGLMMKAARQAVLLKRLGRAERRKQRRRK